MASTITLRRRINSIRNTRQITKAMELVSASKLRRAQEQAQSSRAYREAAYALVEGVSLPGAQFRTDIALRAINHEIKI